MHIGPGPVFVVEWITGARRWQMYAIRAGVISILFAALWLVWENTNTRHVGPMSYKQYADVGEGFYFAVIGTQLALILLAAPGAAAGAICIDKQRGNLLHLMVTDLTDGEIVLDKLAVRLLPVAGLIVASLPVLMLASWLGGLDPEAVAAAYLVMAGSGLFGCALALLLSVWGRKAHEVLLMTYLIEVGWLMSYPAWAMADAGLFHTGTAADWLKNLNPYVLVFAPYARVRGIEWADYAIFLAVCVALATVCTVLAILSVRPCTLRDGVVTAKPRRVKRSRRNAWLLSYDPLLWYERHRRQASRWTKAVWMLFLGGGACATLLGGLCVGGRGGDEVLVFTNMIQLSVGVLLVLVGAVTALADERVRGGLDVLLTTPVPTWQIVRAKWRGAFRPVKWLTILPVIACAAAACSNGHVGGVIPVILLVPLNFAYGAFAVSFGLFVAVIVSRVGRAIGVAVGFYAVQCLGWPMIVLLLTASRGGSEAIGPTLASPFMGGTAMTIFAVEWQRIGGRDEDVLCMIWAVGWSVLLAIGALFFYMMALVAFDNRLGRVPDAGLRPRIAPPRMRSLRSSREAAVAKSA